MKKTLLLVISLVLVFLVGCGYGQVTSNTANGSDDEYSTLIDMEDLSYDDEFVIWEYVTDKMCDDPTRMMGVIDYHYRNGNIKSIEWSDTYQSVWENEEY